MTVFLGFKGGSDNSLQWEEVWLPRGLKIGLQREGVTGEFWAQSVVEGKIWRRWV